MKQVGGFDFKPIKNNAFKYTKNDKRIKWNKHTYPIGEYIISLVQNIPWKDYSFEGEVTLLNTDEKNDGSIVPVWEKAVIKTKPIDKFPYYYFGGCAYEILNSVYSKQLDYPLHKYTDPTGDIDVRLGIPNIEYKPIRDFYEFFFEPAGKNNEGKDTYKMNAFIDNYTEWVYNKVEDQLKSIPKTLFDKIFENTVEFDYKDEYEASFADKATKINNLWLVRTIVNDMIKIQLSIKYADLDQADHILEIVLSAPNTIDPMPDGILQFKNLDNFAKKYMVIKDKIPIESFAELYHANARAGGERIGVLNENKYHHKFYNHVQRALFLNSAISKILNKPGEKDKDKITLDDYNYNTFSNILLVKYIKWIFENKDTICKFIYKYNPKENDCNKQKVIKKLVGPIESMIFKPQRNAKGNRILYYPGYYRFANGGKQIGENELFNILLDVKVGGASFSRKNKRKKYKNSRTRKASNRFILSG
jgi:hypothetical protein